MASVLFVIATAVLALWVEAQVCPRAGARFEVMRTGIHIGIAFVASTVAAPIVSDVVVGTGLPLARLAALAPVKMVFPLAICFFPAILIITAGPGIIAIMNTLGLSAVSASCCASGPEPA